MTFLFADHARELALLHCFLTRVEDQLYIPSTPAFFFDHELGRQVFLLLLQMRSRGYTVVSTQLVKDYIQTQTRQTVPLGEFLDTIGTGQGLSEEPVISASEHIQYLKALAEKRIVKSEIVERTAAMLADQRAVHEILTHLSRHIRQITHEKEVPTLAQVAEEVVADIEKAQQEGPQILETGLRVFDQAIGLTLSTYVLICAKSSRGKSILVNQLAMEIVYRNADIALLYISMEVSRKKLVKNFISYLTRISKRRLEGKGVKLNKDELKRIYNARMLLGLMSLKIIDRALSAEEVETELDIFAVENAGKQLVAIYDHSLLAKVKNNSHKREEINQTSKVFARKKEQHQMLVFALHQIKRNCPETDTDGTPIPPTYEWIQETSEPYQDCDICAILWRPHMQEAIEQQQDSETGYICLDKNRDGMLGKEPVLITAKYGFFADATPS